MEEMLDAAEIEIAQLKRRLALYEAWADALAEKIYHDDAWNAENTAWHWMSKERRESLSG